jgi:tRNA-Thr(GGU) m(6)t(6)A37 methyltransferase TsaA
LEKVIYHPIGIVHSPFQEMEGMPIQPSGSAAAQGTIRIFPDFAEGLVDLEGFSHIILLYHFHRVAGSRLAVTPFLDDKQHGVFATRAPTRPNPIGLSIVELIRREDNVLYVANLDVVDGTPLLDIKPYVPQFDAANPTRLGWLEEGRGDVKKQRADRRFK